MYVVLYVFFCAYVIFYVFLLRSGDVCYVLRFGSVLLLSFSFVPCVWSGINLFLFIFLRAVVQLVVSCQYLLVCVRVSSVELFPGGGLL